MKIQKFYLVFFTFLISISMNTVADIVTLQNATATFSQTNYSIANTIDGTTGTGAGWAISPSLVNQAAVWETSTDINASEMSFSMGFYHTYSHIIGRFKISVTSDDRSTFANGVISGGDVTATWYDLTGVSMSLASGLTYSVKTDNSILLGGTIPDVTAYTATYSNIPIANITGIKLDVLEDPTLPVSGPGLCPVNGNFVLDEMIVNVQSVQIPEINTLILSGLLIAMIIYKKL